MMQRFFTSLMIISLLILAATLHGQQQQSKKYAFLSKEEYKDKCEAIWMAQLLSVCLGWEFEHQPSAVKYTDKFYQRSIDRINKFNAAPVDDDWYYEIVALRAFEKYGTKLTVEQLGQQWLENSAGTWGSGQQTRNALLNGIKAPWTGHPRYNRMWFEMGNQNRCDLYASFYPGMPVFLSDMAVDLGRVNSYAEGIDGGVFVGSMISIAFFEQDPKKVVKQAAQMLDPRTPHRQVIDKVVAMADAGSAPKDIAAYIERHWGIYYPGTSTSVWNAGLGAIAVYFSDGNFLNSVNLAMQLSDYSDADCTAANVGCVLAAMHGSEVLPKNLTALFQNRIAGDMLGTVKLTPFCDEKISDVAQRTAAIGEKLMLAKGVVFENGKYQIQLQKPRVSLFYTFNPNDFVKMWDPEWKLERAGHGAPGGGVRGVRGGTFVSFEGTVEKAEYLSTYPLDEVRGTVLSRTLQTPGKPQNLYIELAADPGRTWRLDISINNDRVHKVLVDGGPAIEWPGIDALTYPPPDEEFEKSSQLRKWQVVKVDLSRYQNQKVTIRLFQSILVRNGFPGNAYWRKIWIE